MHPALQLHREATAIADPEEAALPARETPFLSHWMGMAFLDAASGGCACDVDVPLWGWWVIGAIGSPEAPETAASTGEDWALRIW